MSKSLTITTGIVATVLIAGISLGYYYFVSEDNVNPFTPGNTIDATQKQTSVIQPTTKETSEGEADGTASSTGSEVSTPVETTNETQLVTPSEPDETIPEPSEVPPPASGSSNSLQDWLNFISELWNNYKPSPVRNLEAQLNNSSILGGAVVVLTFDAPEEFNYTSQDGDIKLAETGYFIFEEHKLEGMDDYIKNEIPTYIDGSKNFNYLNSGAVSFNWEDKNGGVIKEVKFTVFSVRKPISPDIKYSVSSPETVTVFIKPPDLLCGVPGIAIANQVNKNLAYLHNNKLSEICNKYKF